MKKNFISTILILCSLFSGCTNSPTKQENHINATKEVLQMKHYDKNIDGVIFDTEICINDKVTEESLIKSTVSPTPPADEKKLVNKFFSHRKLTQNYSSQGINALGQETKFTYLVGSNEDCLSYDNKTSGITFLNNNFYHYISNCIDFYTSLPHYNADKYSLEKELPFSTRAHAFNEIKATLDSVGLDIGNSYKAYAMDYQTMKQEEYATDMDGKEDKSVYKANWTQDDDCYYFLIRPEINSIPTFVKLSSSSDTYIQDSDCPIVIVYNKDGIQYLSINTLFTLNDANNKVSLTSFDKIAETIATPYANILGSNTYKITKATLAYKIDATVMSDKYPITPVWVIEVHECHKDNSADIINEIVVDAVTGEVLINGK